MFKEAEIAKKQADKALEVEKAKKRVEIAAEDVANHPRELPNTRTQELKNAAENLENRQFELDNLR